MNKKLDRYLSKRGKEFTETFGGIGGTNPDFDSFEPIDWAKALAFAVTTIVTIQTMDSAGDFDKKEKVTRVRELELKALSNMTGEEVTDNLNDLEADEYNKLAYGDDE